MFSKYKLRVRFLGLKNSFDQILFPTVQVLFLQVLDTIATTLLMSTGLLTGFQRLELLSHYAIIYQVIFFSFIKDLNF